MFNFNKLCVLLLFILFSNTGFGQPPNSTKSTTTTAEQALDSNKVNFVSKTKIGGYGSAIYQHNANLEKATMNLERFVLFIGHRFNNKISFFSELEIEDAKIEGNEEGGEIALEQAYLKFNLNQTNYFVAGLFIPRIGILNENHLPNTFLGSERNQVESLVIPATWREIGICYYGSMNSLPINYSFGFMNGLNSATFENGEGIRGGRWEGKEASANSMAITAALQYQFKNLKTQISAYYGGSTSLPQREADSVGLNSGWFGSPVSLLEADVIYALNGFQFRGLATLVNITDADAINKAYANNTANFSYGFYAEAGYNILKGFKKNKEQSLIAFVRYENLDLNSKIPNNGIYNGTIKQQHIVTGISYLPTYNVVVKADLRFVTTGEQNPDLIINPSPTAPAYQTNNQFVNLSVGYSF